MLDAELVRLIRRDCHEYVSAYKEYERMKIGAPRLHAEWRKAEDALLTAYKREDDAKRSLDYRVSELGDEYSAEIKEIIKSYMPDLTDAPADDEVVKVVWLNQIEVEPIATDTDNPEEVVQDTSPD